MICGPLGVSVKLLRRKLHSKAKKHYEVKTLAGSKLNSIKGFISKALNDRQISEHEFKTVLEELDKYNDFKDRTRSKQSEGLSEIERKRLMEQEKSAITETAWKNAGLKPGLQIWRIVNFQVTHWPVEDYGKFYDGDSYIILNTYKDEDSDLLLYDVHFWIGKYSTADEYGTAAYKTVELDTYLDDKPVQHREVQGYESKLFKSYFDSITILRGGAESGFRKVEPTKYIPRLLHFHGNSSHVEVTEIPRCRDLLDSSDVYILDMGLKLYQWNGRDSNKDERFGAAGYLHRLKEERGKCTSETLDETSLKCGAFYNKLNETAEQEEIIEEKNISNEDQTKSLYRLSDATGEMEFTLEKEGDISRRNLDQNDVFILDTIQELFVWIGDQTSTNEKKNAMTYAHNYLMRTAHPLLPVTCIKAGSEPRAFLVAMTA